MHSKCLPNKVSKPSTAPYPLQVSQIRMQPGDKYPSLTISPTTQMKKRNFQKEAADTNRSALPPPLPFPGVSARGDTRTRSPTARSALCSHTLSRFLQRHKHLPEMTNLLSQILRHRPGDACTRLETCHTSTHVGKEAWYFPQSPPQRPWLPSSKRREMGRTTQATVFSNIKMKPLKLNFLNGHRWKEITQFTEKRLQSH